MERAEVLRETLGAGNAVEVAETTHRGAAATLAREGAGAFQRILAVGGDGTLNEVLAGIMAAELAPEARPALGFLPAGTANAATRAFGFATDPEAVGRALPSAPVRPVDVGMVTFEGGTAQYSMSGGGLWTSSSNPALWGTMTPMV